MVRAAAALVARRTLKVARIAGAIGCYRRPLFGMSTLAYARRRTAGFFTTMRKRTKNQRQREIAARTRSRDSALRRRRERIDSDSNRRWQILDLARPCTESRS